MTRKLAGRLFTAAAVILLVVILAVRMTDSEQSPIQPEPEWPRMPRVVTVEVLNGGGISGAARDASLKLRRAGLDVVDWDNAPSALRDTVRTSHRIFVRLGDTTGVGRVIEAIGPAQIIDEPDPDRLVDLTVITARPAPEP